MFRSGRSESRGGEWMRGLGVGFTSPVGIWGVWDVCLCLCCGGVSGVDEEWGRGSGRMGLECIVSMDSLCRWQVQVSVYCARRISGTHSVQTWCTLLIYETHRRKRAPLSGNSKHSKHNLKM